MNLPIPVVLFADADSILGTLPISSRSAAVGVLDIVAREGIPLVFCSSKTRAELDFIAQELDLKDPFISENGGGVFVPRGYFGFDVPTARDIAGYEAVEFGKPYAEVVEVLRRAAERKRVDVVGFSDMSIEEVAMDCGVSLLQARLAKLRDYNELCRLRDADTGARRRFVKALQAAGLQCTNAGRYDHVGAALDAGVGLGLLCALFRRAFGTVVTVGLGDGSNGAPLLRRVDLPLVALNDERRTDAIGEIIERLKRGPAALRALRAGRP